MVDVLQGFVSRRTELSHWNGNEASTHYTQTHTHTHSYTEACTLKHKVYRVTLLFLELS